MVILCSD